MQTSFSGCVDVRVLDWVEHPELDGGKDMGSTVRTTALAAAAAAALVLAGSAWSAPGKLSRGIVVKVGEQRSFTRAQLKPGATVKCTYRGHSLSLPVPTRAEGNGVTWPGAQRQGFHLNVIGKPGGSYAVTCGLGASALVI